MPAPRFADRLPRLAPGMSPAARDAAPVEPFGRPLVRQRSYEAGFAAGQAAARAMAETEAASEQARQAAASGMREVGAGLAQELTAAIATLEAGLIEAVHGVLAQALPAALQARAMAELRDILRSALAGGAVHASVSGPPELIEAFRAMLGPCPPMVEFYASDGCEIAMRIDRTRIETRLAAWRARLAGGAA